MIFETGVFIWIPLDNFGKQDEGSILALVAQGNSDARKDHMHPIFSV